MWKYAVLAAVVAAVAVGAVVALASSGDEDTPPAATTMANDLGRARELIRDCRVRSTLSLHSGVFLLQLEDGSQLELPGSSERAIYAEIQRATDRCGPVAIAME